MKKLLFLLLALPTFSAAQQPQVQVPTPCLAGNAFTIRIPVKTRGMSVEYVWYRNDTIVEETPLTAGVTAVSYTIPTNKAYGNSVAYHFKYRMDCDEEWLLSPRYVVNFQAINCPGVSSPGVASVAVLSCNGVSSPGVISVAAYPCSGGVSNAGTVGVTALSCSGGVSSPGVISVAPY